MNMKPPEILSLLEEASGTKLYERKKEGALRTLSKKQTKLDEIDSVGGRGDGGRRGGLGGLGGALRTLSKTQTKLDEIDSVGARGGGLRGLLGAGSGPRGRSGARWP
jgi:hypothetical protein